MPYDANTKPRNTIDIMVVMTRTACNTNTTNVCINAYAVPIPRVMAANTVLAMNMT